MRDWTELERIIGKKYRNLDGLVVQEKGMTVYKKYFNGNDDSSTFHIFSATKSIVCILLGIAIEKGLIKGVEQKILDFFPKYEVKGTDKTIEQITLEDMLTMTVPFRYQNKLWKKGEYQKYFSSEDWVKTALDQIGGKGKIGDFFYAGLIGPDIFSGILSHACKQSVLEFARKNLFVPLGIQVGEPIQFSSKEEQIQWYRKKNPVGWVVSPDGTNTGGWGLCLRATDMAKIGTLMLGQGEYEGKRLVSKDWIARCTSVHSAWNMNRKTTLQYGYLWWIIDEKEKIFAAMGDGGNVIYVNPAKERVIAIASSFSPVAKDRIDLIQNYIEPLLDS